MSLLLSPSIKKYLSILFGAAVLSFALYNIHSRCAISEGGALGLSLLFFNWFGLSPAISSVVLDGLAILAGTFILKKSFFWDSVYASVVFALWYALFETLGPVLPDMSSLPWLAALTGGLFVGVGTSYIVRHGCAAGADDSLALIFHEKTGLRLAVFYVFSDCAVLLLSLTYIPLGRIVWSLITVMISSAVIELLNPH